MAISHWINAKGEKVPLDNRLLELLIETNKLGFRHSQNNYKMSKILNTVNIEEGTSHPYMIFSEGCTGVQREKLSIYWNEFKDGEQWLQRRNILEEREIH